MIVLDLVECSNEEGPGPIKSSRRFQGLPTLIMRSDHGSSNGKSSIAEERLYSFFFVFFPKKQSLIFFVFSLLHNYYRRRLFCFDLVKYKIVSLCFASFSQIFGTSLIVLLSILKKIGLIPFASLCCSKILEQPGSFCFDLQKFRNKQFVSFSILLYFGLDSFLLHF
jgi:hypothetical protein